MVAFKIGLLIGGMFVAIFVVGHERIISSIRVLTKIFLKTGQLFYAIYVIY